MKIKTVISTIFLLTIISLTVFSKSTEEYSVSPKAFFFQLDNYSTSKVLVYEEDNGSIKSKLYFVLKRTDNKLKITILNSDFIVLQKLVDEFRRDGVYLISSLIYEDSSGEKIRTEIFENSLIFPLLDLKKEYGTVASSTSASQPNYTIESTEKHLLGEITKRQQNGEIKIQIVSEGKIERTYTDSNTGKQTYSTISITNTYTKDIGLTLSEQKSKHGLTSIRYIKTISFNEFNKLKTAANNTYM